MASADTNSPAKDSDHVIVVGAGIVGVCCALYARRAGLRVTLIDRAGPGEAASFGNSGSFGTASVPPLGMPGIVWKVPRMLADPMHAFVIRWRYLPRALPWFVRLMRETRRTRVEAIAEARHRLLVHTHESFAPLLAEAGADDLVRHVGRLDVYESEAAMARNAYAFELRRRFAIPMQRMSGDEARALEPALGPVVRCAMFFPDVAYTVNPLRLTQALAAAFVRGGGVVVRETVTGFGFGPDGPDSVVTDAGRHPAARIVLAAGVWSKELARLLGTRVPLESERGYHLHVADAGVTMRIPIAASERNVALTPMEGGLRLATGAEFSGVDAPPHYARAERILSAASAVVPGLRVADGARWYGPRPSTPDSLPVIGRAPRHRNVVFAFGHGHLGLTMAAITGRIVADLMVGRAPGIDLSPYRPERFAWAGAGGGTV